MQKRKVTRATLMFIAMALGCVPLSWCFQAGASTPAIPVSMIVSVEATHGTQAPTIYKEDVKVFHGNERLPVVDWTPCVGDKTGIDLFILIDDSNDTEIGLQLDDLRKFINEQPATVSIGLGYIRNGSVNIVQDLSNDHSLAAKALRLPMGAPGIVGSPYTAITELIHNNREIFLISSGIDAIEPGPMNPFLDEAIKTAKRATIPVNTIYASHAGHLGHSYWRLTWGQSNLSQIADQTGGEAYFQALTMPISYGPYLDRFARRLKHQYRLTFLASPAKEPGFQRIRLETEVPNADLVAADSVYVPATK